MIFISFIHRHTSRTIFAVVDAVYIFNVLIIIGAPGVGKTITSQMLVLYYAAQGYRVRYTTDGADLTGLTKALSQSRETKEVILLDDCFGQAYFNMKETQENEHEHRLAASDRMLLMTLYSSTNTTVSAEHLKRCYEYRISRIPGINHSINHFRQAGAESIS